MYERRGEEIGGEERELTHAIAVAAGLGVAVAGVVAKAVAVIAVIAVIVV